MLWPQKPCFYIVNNYIMDDSLQKIVAASHPFFFTHFLTLWEFYSRRCRTLKRYCHTMFHCSSYMTKTAMKGSENHIWAATWQNQQNDMCAQRRLRSAWASAQSDQSSLIAWRKPGLLATHWAHSEASDQTGRFCRAVAHFIITHKTEQRYTEMPSKHSLYIMFYSCEGVWVCHWSSGGSR